MAEVRRMMRAEDRTEARMARAECSLPEDVLSEYGWVVTYRGKVVGALAFGYGESVLSNERFVAFASTTEVDRNAMAFVRHSKRVLRAAANELPPWVDTLFTAVWTGYDAAVRWLVKTLKFRPAYALRIGGAPHEVMILKKGGA